MTTSNLQTLPFDKYKVGTVGYYAVIDSNKAKGVVNKIEGVVTSCQKYGLSACSYIYQESMAGVMAFLKALTFSQHKTVFIRYTTMLAPLVCLIALMLRLKGKKSHH